MARRRGVRRASTGSIGIWLDTFSFQARPFYERLGYTVFGTHRGSSRSAVSRFFLQKRLDTPPAYLNETRTMSQKLLLLPGDGIGVEVMGEVEKLVAWLNAEQQGRFHHRTGLVGGSAYDKHGEAISEDDMQKALAADAVIFGAVGGPKWDKVPYEKRPEAGLLRLRKDLQLFANLRPAICYPALADASSLKRELVEGLDILIVRELTGGVYFGEPKDITDLGNGQKRAVDTQVYETYEIDRIVPRRLRPRAHARQEGALGRQEERHEVGRAVGRGRAGRSPRTIRTSSSTTSSPTTPRCSWCATPSSST